MTSLEDILGDEVELVTDDSFGWRGEGYARLDDGWVSIPGALPGERVQVLVDTEIGRGRRTFARLLHVYAASAERTDPHCPRVDVCRGCQLRHARPDAETLFKATRIEELLDKHVPGDLTTEIDRVGCSVDRGSGYRWRSNLTYRADGSPRTGLVSGATVELVPMADCPSLTPRCRHLVATVASVMESLEPPWPDSGAGAIRTIEVWASSPAWVRVRAQSTSTRTGEQLEPLLSALRRALPGAQVGWELSQDSWLELAYRAGRRTLVARPGAWVHATKEPAEALYEWLEGWLSRFDGGHLDVGCGVGAVSMLAAASGRAATGIDRDRLATASAAENGSRHGLELEVLTADWEKGARDLFIAERSFETATLNPMREPIGRRTLAFIDKLVTKRLMLLGPSPEAAAKEIAALNQFGWAVENVWSVDLHPASYQTMMAAELVRSQSL